MKTKVISSKVSNIRLSATSAFADKARKLKEEGVDVVDFSTGEPDFDTPDNIKSASIKATKEGFTKYTTHSGIKELREAICHKFNRDNDLEYTPSQIIVSNGAKQSLFNAFMTICEEGDKVLVSTPCYVTFPVQIKLAGGIPVYVPTKEENNFRITLKELSSKYSPDVKVILLNSPNNPSGASFKKQDLEEIADFVVKNKLWVITDEVYENLVYDNVKHVSITSLNQNIKDRTITINSVSKTYAMTGFRVGYAAGPKEIISAMIKLQGHSTGSINEMAQKAAVEAFTGPQEKVEEMRKEYTKRREYMVKKLNSIKGISCNYPDGAFYAFPRISGLYGTYFKNKVLNKEMDIVNYLLDEAHIALVPGSAFEYPNYIRLTFATSMKDIKEGMNRIEIAVNKLGK